MALNIVRRIDDRIRILNVVVSVSDKTGLERLIPGLVGHCPDVKIYSTGGTHAAIGKILGEDEAKRRLIAVSDYTGQPEMQGGLVKTLDFKIYLGLLSETYNQAHQHDLARASAVAIDMVVVNLYPFRQTIAKPGVTPEEARTNIDIGGPCMVRAAAKNYLRVAAVTDPADYAALLAEIAAHKCTLGLDTRFRLMRKAFRHTADYDAAIAGYFAGVEPETMRATYTLQG
ncbi:MAG: hypothetical protein PHR35_02330 [Kiritimatiellae bacterium]|nr:hypothetical protein [Kiritimatiellia bacterium]